MRFLRPGFLFYFAVGLLLCLAAGASAAGQNFAQPAVIPTGSWPVFVGTADLNGDGYPDLIYVDSLTASGQSTWHWAPGDGQGNFNTTNTLAAAWRGSGATVGNFFALSRPQIATAYNGGPSTGGAISCPVALVGIIVDVLSPSGDPTSHYSSGFCSSGSQNPVIGIVTSAVLSDGLAPSLLFTDSANRLLYIVDVSGLQGPGNPITVTSVPLAHGASEIVAADLNNDGHLDLVINGEITGGSSDQVADVYLGDGTGKLTFKGTYNNESFSILVKDVNNDGVPDLIVEGMFGRIDVFPGNGDGSFQTSSAGGTGTRNGYSGNGGHLIGIADLNHDGQLDALTVTGTGVSVLLGQGTQYFGLKGIYNAGDTGGSGTPAYAVADFNQDGNLDLAVDSPEGIAILLGKPDGSFQTSASFATGESTFSLPLGPLSSASNVDGIASVGESQYEFLRGNGDGTFTQIGYGGGRAGDTGAAGSALTGDFNGDGKIDLFVTADANPHYLLNTGNGLFFFAGNGDGTFGMAQQPPLPADSCQSSHPLFGTSAVADFNGDGLADIVNRDMGATRIYLGRTNGTPALAETIADGNCNQTHNLVAAGRLTGGTLPDLLVQRASSLLLYANDGTGKFPQQAMGDLSADGSLTTPGQMTAPALGATFGATSPALGFPAFPGSVAIADLDRDGNLDIIVSYANLSASLTAPAASAPNYLYIWYGSGNGKFLTSKQHPVNPVRLTPSRNFYQVAVADMNLDGIPDLILSDGHILSVQAGRGDGTFGTETHYLAGQGINQISVADVNHDGKLDLVIANGGAVLGNPVAPFDQFFVQPLLFSGGITVLLNHATPLLQTPAGGVTATPEPTTYGEAFGLTATVASSGTSAPTGTVAFSIDGNAVGSASLIGTTATISLVPQNVSSTLTVGTHTLTAVYSGDSNYAQATFTGTHTVSLIPTTIGLALCVDPQGSNFPCGVKFPTVPPPLISPVTMYFGQSIDGLATESGSDLTGQIIFYNGTTVFCTLNANLQQGGMTCPTASGFFPVGNTTVTVDYTGDSTHAASMSNAVQVIVSPDITMATVTSSQNPSTLGQSVTFTANVQGNYASATGPVTFLDGSAVLGMATLDATGHAVFTATNLALGHHPITVSYAANVNFNAAMSPVLTQVVATAVTGSVAASPEPSVVGNAFTLAATVVPPSNSAATVPTGTVAFSVDGTLIGQATLVNGVATLIGPTTLAVGIHTLTAVYSGDANYLTATFPGGHTVILSPTTTTLLPVGTTTIYYGQPASSGYNVLGASGTHPPTGFITVQDNGVSVLYCTAIALHSSCPYADGGANKLTVGTHALVVLYLGDSFNAPSASPPLVFTVLPDTTTATLTSSDNPALLGTSVTFKAKLAGNYVTPSGTVSFMDGATTLGAATLDGNGGASFTTSSLALGTHPITVVYNSNPNFNPVASAVNQLITDGPTTFTITVTPTPVTVEIGHDAVLQVKVTATGGFAEPVQLSCPSVPEEATCLFTQTLIPAGGGFSTLYFSPRAPRDCGSGTSYGADLGSHPIPTTGVVLACLAMLPLYRRRRLVTRAILVSLVTLCGLGAISGCGHCTDLGTRPGTYTFTVTGTAQGSTPLTASQTSTVTVTTVP